MGEVPAIILTLSSAYAANTFLAAEDAGTAAALEELFRSGGILSVSFAVAWYFLKRSDNREGSIRKDLEKELREERISHAETRSQLMTAIKDLARAIAQNHGDNEDPITEEGHHE